MSTCMSLPVRIVLIHVVCIFAIDCVQPTSLFSCTAAAFSPSSTNSPLGNRSPDGSPASALIRGRSTETHVYQPRRFAVQRRQHPRTAALRQGQRDDDDNDSNGENGPPSRSQPPYDSAAAAAATTPFNQDIARTVFPPLPHYYRRRNAAAGRDDNYGDRGVAPRAVVQRRTPFRDPFSDPSSARTAERMLRRMMDNRARSGGRTSCPDRRTFRFVAGAFVRLRNDVVWEEDVAVTAVDKVEELLRLQVRLYRSENLPECLRPDVAAYNRVLHMLARQSDGESGSASTVTYAERALEILHAMTNEEDLETGNHDLIPVSPNPMSYAYAIEALSSHICTQSTAPLEQGREDEESGQRSREWFFSEAETFLSVLEQTYLSSKDIDNVSESPTGASLMVGEGWEERNVVRALVHSYQNLIEGWGRHATNIGKQNHKTEGPRRKHAILKTNELMERLETMRQDLLEEKGKGSSSWLDWVASIPSSECYTSAILAWSTSGHSDAPSKAEELLNRSMALYESKQWGSNVPDIRSWTACIAAFGKLDDAPNAESVLLRMVKLYESGLWQNGGCWSSIPLARAFSTCIAAWGKYDPSANVGDKRNGGRKGYTARGPSHHQLVKNADRAEDLLNTLERLVKRESTKGNDSFVIPAVLYNTAIQTRIRTGQESALEEAIHLLDRMENDMRVTPDEYTYSILLHECLQRSGAGHGLDAAEQADVLLRRMERGEIQPNAKHYSSVLNAYAKAKDSAGARCAFELLRDMEQWCEKGRNEAKPDMVCYSIVIDAYARSGLPEASKVAEDILERVETKFAAGDRDMKPSDRLYTAAVLALVNCRESRKAQRAWSIRERMEKNGVMPNAFTYNYIINCASCSSSYDDEENRVSFEVAVKAFQELRKSSTEKTNSFTYAFFLKACASLLSPGNFRSKVATRTFGDCCKGGHLNDVVLGRLRRCISSDEYYDLLGVTPSPSGGNDAFGVGDLPAEWSRGAGNVQRYGKNASDDASSSWRGVKLSLTA